MARAFAVLLALVSVGAAAGCTGDGTEPAPPTATGPSAVVRPAAVYLVRRGKVAPVRRTVSLDAASPDPISSTLAELGRAGPTADEWRAGYRTVLDCAASTAAAPVGCGGLDVGDDGVARVPGSELPPRLAQAQIVYTLTRFPAVREVAFVVDGKEGRPLTRASFEAETPQILVESPLRGETVRSPIRLRGTANVFEATVSIDVRDARGELLRRTFTTATSGTGTRGTFDTELALPGREGEVTIVGYESSAQDGRPLHVVELPLELAR